MRSLITVLMFIAVSPTWAAEATVTDGDTLLLNGASYRLEGIDAPETDQVCLDHAGAVWACGIEARDRLKDHVKGRDVRCDGKKYDTVYRNRRVGLCRIEGEAVSLNQWLVREGWAMNAEPYSRGRFKADEDDARRQGRGIWKGCFARPHEAHRSNKSTAQLLGAACPKTGTAKVRDLLFPAYVAMPAGCSIKGRYAVRANVTGHRGIYHMEGCRSYRRTEKPHRWFCSEDEAQAEGFRKSFTC